MKILLFFLAIFCFQNSYSNVDLSSKDLFIKNLIESKHDNPEFKVPKLNLGEFSDLQKLRLIRELELNLEGELSLLRISDLESVRKYYCHEKQYFENKRIFINVHCPNPQNIEVLNGNHFRDLFFDIPSYHKYKKAAFAKSIKLFMFCREDRSFPCSMVMKDINDKPYRQTNGDLWVQPSLGYSRYQKPYYMTDGNTPMGLFEINGVMPKANKLLAYGKYRRLILNRISYSKNSSNNKLLLPSSHKDLSWWKQADEAYNNGRGLFRIHGAGMNNANIDFDNYFPFTPTRGCVAQREGSFNLKYGENAKYKDQKLLLNEMMKAMGLRVHYDNHTKIKGLFYLIEIDNQKAPVTRTDLETLGII